MKINVYDIEWEEGYEQEWNELDIELTSELVQSKLENTEVKELIENYTAGTPGIDTYNVYYDFDGMEDLVKGIGAENLLTKKDYYEAAELVKNWLYEFEFYHKNAVTRHKWLAEIARIFGGYKADNFGAFEELVYSLGVLAKTLVGGAVSCHYQSGKSEDWDDVEISAVLPAEKIAAFEIACYHCDYSEKQHDYIISSDIVDVLTSQDCWAGSWLAGALEDSARQDFCEDGGTSFYTYYREKQ